MIVETHDGLAQPRMLHATRVLITSDDGTPICFILEFPAGNGQSRFRTYRAGDPDFNEQLKASGIARTVTVQRLDAQKLVLGA
jgi:hypothetical protein